MLTFNFICDVLLWMLGRYFRLLSWLCAENVVYVTSAKLLGNSRIGPRNSLIHCRNSKLCFMTPCRLTWICCMSLGTLLPRCPKKTTQLGWDTLMRRSKDAWLLSKALLVLELLFITISRLGPIVLLVTHWRWVDECVIRHLSFRCVVVDLRCISPPMSDSACSMSPGSIGTQRRQGITV
jgi:hypothetical protein